MVNVGENRARNGVTDCPESRNEETGFLPSARYAHLTVWSGAMRLTSESQKNGLKSQFCLEDAILILPFDDFDHTHKISIQSIITSILKAPQGLDRTRERFCKSGSSFYPQNSVWIAINLSRNLSSEVINNINYLMTIKAMSLTLNVQKDSIRYHCEVRK
ncbi:hypothetical protein E3N88_26743 [Mikania micrantha]|uniref:Uncharacterized protein n=1 Tax=Mikania micrantha TaxID=192012 RepID=A0A5N6MXP1_9ASTR|nr:hypothetical protein E3N88_26743 [Mikania micrantha]